MGFNKRVLKKDNIIKNIDILPIYLSADAIITTDDFSREVYKMYCDGKTKEEIINYINNNNED
jgi:hypothetical protein